MNKEIWKDIKGYENLYRISNLGNVYSIRNNKILKPRLTCANYYQVDLCKKGDIKKQYVHRLVAKAFIPNPNDYLIINHKDENPKNNVVDNLEWCDSKYNNNYGSCKKKISIANSIKINQYDLDGKFIKQWVGIRNISKEININKGNICSCCKGKRNNAGGFIWRYANE